MGFRRNHSPGRTKILNRFKNNCRRNNKRRKTNQNTGMSGEEKLRTDTRRIQGTPQKHVNTIWSSVL